MTVRGRRAVKDGPTGTERSEAAQRHLLTAIGGPAPPISQGGA